MFTLGMSKYADELIKLGFSDRLCCNEENCKQYLDYCTKYNMVWFNNSYGTIVHKDFDKYFKEADRNSDEGFKMWQDLSLKEKNYMFALLDHTNFICTVDTNEYIITSSPYQTLDDNILQNLMKYPYNVYIIHPRFLNYHVFVSRFMDIEHPLYGVNYAFTKISNEDIWELNMKISEDINIFPAFVKIK